jgi:hypothetical protein
MAAVGERCLELGVAESDPTVLVKELDRALRGCTLSDGGTECGDLRKSLGALRRAEFAHGDMVRVDGWVLSRSEARSYALSAIVSARS